MRLGRRIEIAFVGTVIALSGCGGGDSTSSPTVTSVSASCSPTSITTAQTSQCTATVQGTGSYSSGVSWTATGGTITSAGVFTPSATGTATITATSTEDSTKSGNASITVTPPPTITSVTVSCSPTTVQEDQTSQCTATVQGTGNFDPTVTWAASLGTIASTAKDTATYTAPSSTTGSATVTATSSEDATKSGIAALNVTRTPPSGSWQHTGPVGGGTITVFAENPSSPSTIYADGDNHGAGALWKSVDSGTTWTPIITNSDLDYDPIADMAIVNGGQVFYACGRGWVFHTSIDGGTTWTDSHPVSSSNVLGGMAVDPQNYATIYLSAPGLGVVKSVDSGTTWALLASSPVIAAGTATAILHNPIEVDPTTTSTVYYGTDHGLYISKDSGTTWSPSANGIASSDVEIQDVAVDPAAPSSIFLLAGLSRSTVVDLYESTNAGNSWTPLATALDAERVVPDPNNASIIYLYGLQVHSAYKSIDGGHTFVASDSGTPSAGSTGPSGSSILLSGPTGTMIPLASSPNSFLMALGGVGIYKTVNAAQSWSFASAGVSAWNGIALAFDPEVSTTLYFGAVNGGGIFKSTDGGHTWPNVRSGDSVTDIAVDPFDSTHMLAATLEEGLIASHDGGNTWTNISSNLPTPSSTAFITGIHFHPELQGTIFVAASTGGVGLMLSSDGGATFASDNTGLSTTSVGGCLAIKPQNPKTLLIADAVGLATSTDGGNTWVETASPVSCPFSVDAKSNPTIIYATEPNYAAGTGTAVRSFDFGKTWTSLNASVPLLADPSTANSVFSVNSWSPDAGTTWYPLLSNGLGQSLLEPGGWGISGLAASGAGMVIAPSSPQVMFVASWDDAMWYFVVGP